VQSQGQRPDGKAVWLFQQSPPMSLKELNNNAFVDIHCVILCTGSSRYTAGQVDFKKEYSNKFGKISAERRKSMYIYMYIYIYSPPAVPKLGSLLHLRREGEDDAQHSW